MSILKIKDLVESIDLDREAMLAITGGARLRGRQPPLAQSPLRSTRIVDYPAGLGSGIRRSSSAIPGKAGGGK